MKALIYNDNDGLKLVDNIEKPTANDNEVLIKTSLVGICNTDYEITKGYMGYNGILGHEFVGIVEQVGKNVDKNLIGKKVTGGINLACNDCSWCHRGLQRHCPNRSTLGIYKKDGCFCEYFTLPKENINIIPDNVEDEKAAFIEPLAAALEILEQVKIEPTTRVALVGDGKLGLCISLILNAYNVDLTHIGKHLDKLQISKNFGSNILLINELEEKDKKTFDVVIEATGSTGGFETSLSLTKPRGILVLKSTIAAKEGLNLAGVVVDEITIVGSRCGQFEPIIRLLKNNKINPIPLITKIYDKDDFIEAFKENEKKDTIKVLVKF